MINRESLDHLNIRKKVSFMIPEMFRNDPSRTVSQISEYLCKLCNCDSLLWYTIDNEQVLECQCLDCADPVLDYNTLPDEIRFTLENNAMILGTCSQVLQVDKACSYVMIPCIQDGKLWAIFMLVSTDEEKEWDADTLDVVSDAIHIVQSILYIKNEYEDVSEENDISVKSIMAVTDWLKQRSSRSANLLKGSKINQDVDQEG